MERAFEAYQDIYLATNDSFPGINAATLALLRPRGGSARARGRVLNAPPWRRRSIITWLSLGPRPCSS